MLCVNETQLVIVSNRVENSPPGVGGEKPSYMCYIACVFHVPCTWIRSKGVYVCNVPNPLYVVSTTTLNRWVFVRILCRVYLDHRWPVDDVGFP